MYVINSWDIFFRLIRLVLCIFVIIFVGIYNNVYTGNDIFWSNIKLITFYV